MFAPNVRIRIRAIAWWTRTHCPVILCRTNSIDSTSLQRARVNTFSIDAGLSERAFRVTLASS